MNVGVRWPVLFRVTVSDLSYPPSFDMRQVFLRFSSLHFFLSPVYEFKVAFNPEDTECSVSGLFKLTDQLNPLGTDHCTEIEISTRDEPFRGDL